MNSSRGPGQSNPQKAETTLVTAGRDTKAQKGFVNPPVVHGSTVLYPTAADLHAHRSEFQYWPARYADHQGAAGGADGPGGTAMRRRRPGALRARGDFDHLDCGVEGRRPPPGLRQCVPALAQFLQWRADPLWRRDHL